MDAHRHYGPAAFALGLEAWRQGNDVYQALSQAGYVATVAAGLASYFSSGTYVEEPPPLTQVSQGDEEGMSAKRARISSSSQAVAPGVKKYVKGCMDRLVEEKAFPLSVQSGTSGTTGTVSRVGIADIVQGTTSQTRLGDIIHLQRLVFNWYAYDTVAATVRVILFVDRQANGTTPSATGVLNQATVTGPYSATDVIGYGGGRYKILSDESVTINPTIAAAGWESRLIKKEIKLAGMPVIYSASTGAVTDVSKNNIWVLHISDNNTSTFVRSSMIYYRDN